MNQIELEKIADFFDKDRSGMIDLSDIMSTLKGGTRQTRRRVTQEVVSDAQKIDTEVCNGGCVWSAFTCRMRDCLYDMMSLCVVAAVFRYKCNCLIAPVRRSFKLPEWQRANTE